MSENLRFGYNQGRPPGNELAWGARLIVTQDGAVDFVWDRQDCVGPDGERQMLLDYLADVVADRPWVHITTLLKSGEMQTRAAREFVVYEDSTVTMKANTNASCGYCYVVAYFNSKKENQP
jgi:hypothetical protein